MKTMIHDLHFICESHQKQIFAFCTYDDCAQRIFCIRCIRQSHPHSESNFKNIADLSKIQNFTPSCHSDRHKGFLKAYHKVLDSIQELFQFFGQIFEPFTTSLQSLEFTVHESNDCLLSLKETYYELISRDIQAPVEATELNKVVEAYLNFLRLESRIRKMQQEMQNAFLVLGRVSGPILTAVDYASKIDGQSLKDNQSAQTASEIVQEQEFSNGDSQIVISNGVNVDMEVLEQPLPNTDVPTHDKSDGKMEIEPLPNGLNHINDAQVEEISQLPKRRSPSPSKNAPEKPIIVDSSGDKPKKSLHRSEQIVKRAVPENERPSQQELEHIFNQNKKGSVEFFKKWFRNSKFYLLDGKVKEKLDNEEEIYKNFKRTTKQQDIRSINKTVSKFLIHIESTGSKLNMTHLQETITMIKKGFLNEYAYWLTEEEVWKLIKDMKNSRVAYDGLLVELEKRATGFESKKKLDFKEKDSVSIDKYEGTIHKLWKFRIKMRELEGLLNKYFECKEIMFHSKYIFIRINQLARDLKSQLIDSKRHREILKELQEIQNAPQLWAKRRVAAVCEWIDLGADFESLLDAISEQADELLNRWLYKKDGNDTNIIPDTACDRSDELYVSLPESPCHETQSSPQQNHEEKKPDVLGEKVLEFAVAKCNAMLEEIEAANTPRKVEQTRSKKKSRSKLHRTKSVHPRAERRLATSSNPSGAVKKIKDNEGNEIQVKLKPYDEADVMEEEEELIVDITEPLSQQSNNS